MKTSLNPAIILCAALLGCAAPANNSNDTQSITPTQAILLAANAAPQGVKGTFLLEVRATGRMDGNIYLNSELDYRDQRDLTIAIHPEAARQFLQEHGQDVDDALKGKHIRVSGEALRVRIGFFANGQLTDKYYYQTHINVFEANQIEVLP